MADLEKLFQNMPNVFDAEKAGEMAATVQFNLSGDGGGDWYVQIAGGQCTTHKGTTEDATATIKMDATDYADMTSGKLNAITAFMQGKVKVEGDLNTVMKFQTLFAN